MPLVLRHRRDDLRERMDDPACDPRRLANTFRQFAAVNRLLARTRTVYARWVRPRLQQPSRHYTLLDIGFGGGDIAIQMAEWARRDGHQLTVTGIESDPRAADFVAHRPHPVAVEFRLATPIELLAEGRTYDFVISNHLLHHLAPAEFTTLLGEARRLSRGRVVFVDLRRSDVAYALFAVATLPIFRDSFIREDGLISIRRSYTPDELARLAPPGWRVERLAPFRLVLRHDADDVGHD